MPLLVIGLAIAAVAVAIGFAAVIGGYILSGIVAILPVIVIMGICIAMANPVSIIIGIILSIGYFFTPIPASILASTSSAVLSGVTDSSGFQMFKSRVCDGEMIGSGTLLQHYRGYFTPQELNNASDSHICDKLRVAKRVFICHGKRHRLTSFDANTYEELKSLSDEQACARFDRDH